MKTEMKKNNKMFLALVVVAALAAVSFAGIALSDDSDAALISNNIVIQPGETSTVDYNFYVPEGDFFEVFEFEVKATGHYTGTISLGTANADRSVYTAYSTLKLTNVSAVRITGILYNSEITGEVVSAFMIGNTDKAFEGVLPSGTYELMKGQIVLGSPYEVDASEWTYMKNALNPVPPAPPITITDALTALQTGIAYMITNEKIVSFCGTVSAGELSVTSSYTVGTMISLSAAGGARISSLYMSCSPNEAMPEDPISGDLPDAEDRTLSISGTASVQYPEVVQRFLDRNISDVLATWPAILSNPVMGPLFSDMFRVDSLYVTIEDGAVITAGDRAPTVAQTVTIDTGATAIFAYLFNSDGMVYHGVPTASGVNFGYVPIGTYMLAMGLTGTGGLNAFYGTATVSGSGISFGMNQLAAAGAIPVTDLTVTAPLTGTTNTLDYLPANYMELVLAFNESTSEVGKLASPGKIGFQKSNVLGGNYLFVVLKGATAGMPMKYFYGDISVSNQISGLAKSRASSGALAADEFRAGTSGGVGIMDTFVNIISNDASHFLVKGEVKVLYNGSTNFATMDIVGGDAYLNFEGEGIISYGVPVNTPPLISDTKILGGTNGRVVAAYFYINEGSPVTKSTYYFTTLKKALTMSNEITLTGKHVILEDTTFDNPDFTEIRIILGPGAELEIGKDNSDGTPAISAILTIPAKTKVIVPSDPLDPRYRVINGQAVYDVQPNPLSYEPYADVLIKRTSPTKFIYTDIGTGLDISVSGDVLDLRKDASLFRDATLKEGVILNDTAAGDLIIEDGVILIIKGTLNSKYAMEIRGTLRIDSIANFTDGADAKLGGTIVVTSSGVLNVKGISKIRGWNFDPVATIGPDTTKGVIDVAGEANIEGTGTAVDVGTLLLSGKLNVKTGATITVNTLLQIGKTPTLSPMSETYSNTAAITGKITLTSAAIAKVYGNLVLTATGTNANIDAGSGTLVKTEYMIEGNLYVTVYCTGTQDLPMYYEHQLLDIKIKDWYNDPYLTGDSLKTKMNATPPTTPSIGATGWTIVYADWEWKMYTVTFNYVQGMKWVSNGIDYAGGAAVEYAYGTNLVVSGAVQPGYEGTPVIKVNGANYVSPYKVTGAASFTATGVQTATVADVNDGLTLIEILLIIIVIIIAVIALIIAIRLLRS